MDEDGKYGPLVNSSSSSRTKVILLEHTCKEEMTGSRPQSAPPTTPTPNLPPNFDYQAYFATNIDYNTLKQHETVIKQQLKQTEDDIKTLKTMKEQAIADPDTFIKHLKVHVASLFVIAIESQVSKVTTTHSDSID
jgi:hypothetical protein